MKNDPLKPSIQLLSKLGSIAVHADEMLSAKGHTADKAALQALLRDADVVAWCNEMTKMAMLPVKR